MKHIIENDRHRNMEISCDSKDLLNRAMQFNDWLVKGSHTENAIFGVEQDWDFGMVYKINWKGGSFKGNWRGNEWEDGIFMDGIFRTGMWHGGAFIDGSWEGSRWFDGMIVRMETIRPIAVNRAIMLTLPTEIKVKHIYIYALAIPF